MKRPLGLAALAAGTALVLPAAAQAHPSVYASKANIVVNGALQEQTRYVVSNHGFTMVLRETNNVSGANQALKTQGVVGYNLIPNPWRTGKPFAELMTTGGSDAQAHATCLTPALQSEAAIKSWQDADAFYNYVPFQTSSAGLEDDPARWLPTLTGAGFDTNRLTSAAAAEAECEKVAGAEYVPADAVQTTAASLADGTVKEATAPLNTQVSTLQSQVTQLQNQVTTLQAAAAAAQVNPGAKTVRAFTLKLSAKKFAQAVAMVTGEPNTAVTVKATLASKVAKKLKIARTISSKSLTLDGSGAALVDLGLTKKAAKAVDKHKPALKITVEAAAGATKKTARGTLTR
jgi:hypothetical protein